MNLKLNRQPEQRSTPREAFNLRLVTVVVSAALGAFNFGYNLAFIGGVFALPSFTTRFDLTPENSIPLKANVVSLCSCLTYLFFSLFSVFLSS